MEEIDNAESICRIGWRDGPCHGLHGNDVITHYANKYQKWIAGNRGGRRVPSLDLSLSRRVCDCHQPRRHYSESTDVMGLPLC
ncbi:cyclin-dependent kinase 5 activator 1 [Biomphalaria glabrata]